MISFRLFVLAGLLYMVLSFETYGENYNSCADVCPESFDPQYMVDLNQGVHELKDQSLVEVLEEIKSVSDEQCSKNVLLRIPFFKLSAGTIVKIELEYEAEAHGTTFHIGNSPTNDLYGADRNTTMYNAEIYANDTSLSYYLSSASLCAQGISSPHSNLDIPSLLFLNESINYITPLSKINIYVAEKWFRVEYADKNASSFFYNSDYLFTFRNDRNQAKCQANSYSAYPMNRTSPFLYIGLNRAIADANLSPGSGLCSVKISMMNCNLHQQPDLDVDIKEIKYTHLDNDNIIWINPLSYTEPSSSVSDHPSCSAQGVLKVIFDPSNHKKIARFDFEFGDVISGFTFNIGDSPTNNGYGGDSGTTSNSAEIHSNENRFYVWLNTKYCGETLLHRVEYSLFQSGDKVTIFVSDERVEVLNNRDYQEVFRGPYLYNLNDQNVTCNCFDTLCYPSAKPDKEIYLGINRVIGGTFRPGVGLCRAKVSWLQCKVDVRTSITKPGHDYVDYYNYNQTTTSSTTSTTTSTTSTSTTTTTTTTSTSTTTSTTSTTTTSTSTTTSTESSTSVSTEQTTTTLDLLAKIQVETQIVGNQTNETSEAGNRTKRELSWRKKYGKMSKGTPLVIHQSVVSLNSSSPDAVEAVRIDKVINN